MKDPNDPFDLLDLSNLAEIYAYELRQIPSSRLPAEAEVALAARARQGDQQARDEIVLHSLHYVATVAKSYAATFASWLRHDNYMDLVAVGNLALVEGLERALERAERPCAYLNGLAKKVILHFCVCKSALITLPQYSLGVRKLRMSPVESLDAQLRGTELTYLDIVGILSEIDAELDDSVWRPNYRLLHTPLQEALQKLTDKQREVIDRHFGLDGEVPESLYVISNRLSPVKRPNPSLALRRLQRALKVLREELEPYIEEFLRQPEE